MSSDWTVISASVRGSMHDRRGLPNQDAVATTEAPGAAIAAVADGHGGQRYVRSDVGSAMAVEIACDEAASRVAAGGDLAALLQSLPAAIVERWRRAVGEHVAAHPFEAEERERAGTALESEPELAYGATLLLAIALGDEVGLLQLGDGDAIVATAAGNVLTPVPEDDRLVGGQTTSLCMSSATSDFRWAVVPVEMRAELVLLASDGYGNSFADGGWRAQVANDLRDRIGREGAPQVQRDLPGWLGDSANAAGDDVTVAILSRRAPDATVRPDATVTTGRSGGRHAAAPAATSAAPRPAPARRTPWLALLAVGALALLAGVLVGRATSDGSSTQVASASTTTTGPAATVPASGAPEVRVVGPKGSVIVFDADPAAPDAHVEGTAASPVTVAQMVVGSDVWAVAGGRLTVRPSGGRAANVDLEDLSPASLVYAEGLLWVIDADETRLAVVDPVARQLVAGGVKRISDPLAGSTSSGSSG